MILTKGPSMRYHRCGGDFRSEYPRAAQRAMEINSKLFVTHNASLVSFFGSGNSPGKDVFPPRLTAKKGLSRVHVLRLRDCNFLFGCG